MLKSSLFNYSDEYMPVKWKITITEVCAYAAATQTDQRSKQVKLKNCGPFTDCRSEINMQVDNAKDWDGVMLMYNLVEYSDYYSKLCGSLWQYGIYGLNAIITDSESFKLRARIKGRTRNASNTEEWNSCVIKILI